MVNTLWNTPEKVTTTPNRSWSSMLKKIVAWAIALTLSGQPAEIKAFNKQEFPTEMVANIPWEISPMTENVEQATLPNYIKQAENWVRKYYPQYENYFKPVFTEIYTLSKSTQNIINKKVQENFELFEEELTNEKDRITTILLTLEKIFSWQNQLSQDLKWNAKGRGLIEIADEISNDAIQQARAERKKAETERDQARANRDQARTERDQARTERDQARAERDQARAERDQAQQETIILRKRANKLNEIRDYINSNELNWKTMEWITYKIEEYFNLYEIKEIKEDSQLQKMIKQYIIYLKQINRAPSNRWRIFIEEYNKINNK